MGKKVIGVFAAICLVLLIFNKSSNKENLSDIYVNTVSKYKKNQEINNKEIQRGLENFEYLKDEDGRITHSFKEDDKFLNFVCGENEKVEEIQYTKNIQGTNVKLSYFTNQSKFIIGTISENELIYKEILSKFELDKTDMQKQYEEVFEKALEGKVELKIEDISKILNISPDKETYKDSDSELVLTRYSFKGQMEYFTIDYCEDLNKIVGETYSKYNSDLSMNRFYNFFTSEVTNKGELSMSSVITLENIKEDKDLLEIVNQLEMLGK